MKMHALRYKTLLTRLLEDLLAEAKIGGDTAKTISLLARLEEEQRSILELYPDQWTAHSRLIELILTETPASADALAKHRGYLSELRSAHSYLRGPSLAELLLLQTWAKQTQQSADVYTDVSLPACWAPSKGVGARTVPDEVARMLVLYADRFQGKQCCFSDLKPFLATLGEGGVAGLAAVASVKEWANSRSAALQTELEALASTHGLADRISLTDSNFATAASEKAIVSSGGGKGKGKDKGKVGSKDKGKVGSKEVELSALNVQEADRTRAAVLLCSLCKAGQLSAFCSLLLKGEPQVSDITFKKLFHHVIGCIIGPE